MTGRMDTVSKYLLDKFLFTIDRDPELVERYRTDPAGTLTWWESRDGQPAPQLPQRRAQHLAGLRRRGARALREHDHVALFGLGAHPFLTLTLFIAMFERDHGPLEYQRAYGAALQHLTLPYPDIAT